MKTCFFFGFSPWRKYLDNWFPGERCVVVSRKPKDILRGGWLLRILMTKNASVYVWGLKYPRFLKSFCKMFAVPFFHVEDGFVRSVSLGAFGGAPASLTFDSKALYFDATRRSELEAILSEYDFAGDSQLMVRSQRGIDLLIANRVSKYNLGRRFDIGTLLGEKTRKRVLVVGQVETDESIRLGCDRTITNNDLVRSAAQENPGAEIIYKPHPEILHGTRSTVSDPKDVADICYILTEDIAPSDVFESIDHVYTITSLLGFEALLRGIKVTCFGLPFYAGWGATDDRQLSRRRKRVLSVSEIFAGSYLIYPKYFDPQTGTSSNLEDVLSTVGRLRSHQD